MLQKEDIIDQFGGFLYDFAYTKVYGKDVFEQGFTGGKKLLVLNISPYSDGIMLEMILGLNFKNVESILNQFSKSLYHEDDISLTYWFNLTSFSDEPVKRYFLTDKAELQNTAVKLEELLVRKGFYWLDEFSDCKALAEKIHQSIISEEIHNKNLYLLCQRSLILQRFSKTAITDEIFYNYYEILQLHKAPESQLEEFFRFRKFLQELIL